jgi:hypothetical protein
MKFIKTLLLVMISVTFAAAQKTVTITCANPGALMINDIKLDGTNPVRQLTVALGTPDKIETFKSGEEGYFYEESGFVFFTKDSIIKALGVNFTWDGDKKFPEKSFTGILSLGELAITRETKMEAIAAIKDISFVCPIPFMCASSDKAVMPQCSVAFKDGMLTQVVFLFR